MLQVAIRALKLGAFTYVIKDTQALASIKHIVNTLCNGNSLAME
jgi:hypothetical protein